MTASCGDSAPNPATISDTITASLDATVPTPPTPPDECTLNAPTWSWQITQVQYSPDGTTWGDSPGGDSSWIVQLTSSSPIATAYSSFSDNDNDGGYWKVTCTVTVVYTDDGTDTWQGSDSVDDKEKVVTIAVWRKVDGGADYLPIKDANNNVTLLVGQFVNLKAVVRPADTTGTYQWKNPPGTTFYDYEFDVNTATLWELPADDEEDSDGLLTDSVLHFYWTDDADNRNVVCTFTPDGGKAMTTPTISLNVKRPKVSSFTSKIGTAQLFTETDGTLSFRLCDANGAGKGMPGISWTATVDSIKADFGAEGQWQFVQRAYKLLTYKDDKGNTYTWKPANTWLLDTDKSLTIPYDGTYDTGSGAPRPRLE